MADATRTPAARLGETWRDVARDAARRRETGSGNKRKPKETDGNRRKPTETDGNRRKPTETDGNQRNPTEIAERREGRRMRGRAYNGAILLTSHYIAKSSLRRHASRPVQNAMAFLGHHRQPYNLGKDMQLEQAAR